MNPDWIDGLIGGALIGGAAGLLLLGAGRIAGISGILGGLLDSLVQGLPGGAAARRLASENALFLLGLVLAPLVYLALGGVKEIVVEADAPTLIAAGLLVGVGTRMGSGCTSGHGVCGAARLSPRSLVAMGVFMAAAIVTVALSRLV